jgi:hypothetical protein
MKTQIGIFLVVIFGMLSCTTPQQKRGVSQWAALDGAGAISCSPWPLQEAELDVASISATSAGKGGFVATMRLRNGSQLPVFAETNGNETVSKGSQKPFPIGRNAYVIAVSYWKKMPVAFVIQNKNERAWLEIRGIRDNRMISRMATPFSDEATSGSLILAKNGWWLQVNHNDSLSSFVYINPENAGDWKFIQSAFQSNSRFTTLAGNGKTMSSYVVERVKNVDENQSKFAITRLDETGKFSEVGKLSVATKGGVESWSAAKLGEVIVLSSVRGDSLVGQGVLDVVAANISEAGVSESWKKEFPYPDVHLGEPTWLSNGSTAFLGIMRWVDGEATMSRIKVDSTGATLIGDAGVFSKGTVLAAGYLNDSGKGLGAFRFREKELWKYNLCEISVK